MNLLFGENIYVKTSCCETSIDGLYVKGSPQAFQNKNNPSTRTSEYNVPISTPEAAKSYFGWARPPYMAHSL